MHLRYHGTSPREPYEYPVVADIVRKRLRLRYVLIPYLVEQGRKANEAELPVLWALVLHHFDPRACRGSLAFQKRLLADRPSLCDRIGTGALTDLQLVPRRKVNVDKVIITAAVTGSSPTKEMNPAVPYSPEEIARSAVECYRAGAAVAHIHVRDPETGRPEFRIELFREVIDRIRHECDMIINLTTSGYHLCGDNVNEKRLQPVALRPELCSLDLGSVNFRERAFVNPPQWGETAAKRMREVGVKPEIEVFDVGHIYQALDLIEQGLIDEPSYFQLCMGVQWGIAATPENLLFMKSKLPPNARWSVLGIGRAELPMIALGILLGGNVRVGFEDNIYLAKGVLAQSNAQLVEMAASLVGQLQREIATPSEACGILGISR